MTPNLMTDKVEITFNDETLNKLVETVITTKKEAWLSKLLGSGCYWQKNNKF